MIVADLKSKFGIEDIELVQWKKDGSFMANVVAPNGVSLQLFTTKKTGGKVDNNSPITVINGKFYIGEVSQGIAKITLKL